MLSWWFRLTTPSLATGVALTPLQRMRQRRARLISSFSLVIFVGIALGAPVTISNPHHLWIFVAVDLCCEFAALIFNRYNLLILAGMSCIIGVVIGLLAGIMGQGSFGITELFILALFVIPEIMAGALLPPVMVFVVALINSVVIVMIVLQAHTTPDLAKYLYDPTFIFVPLLFLHFVVALITYILVRGLLNEATRADRAEEVAALHREIASYEHEQAQEKQRLEEAVQQIAYALTQVSNGHLEVRVSPGEGQIVGVVGPLNNLLSYLQQWRQDAAELGRLRAALQHVTREIQMAGGRARPFQPTGTALDPLFLALSRSGVENENQRSTLPPTTGSFS
ncbi:MAG TPA: hypothetical protein VKR06_17035 [Ktedonosporobacter sp.]|nr:hypothetical protein [Ktedonosporobacter sp.]